MFMSVQKHEKWNSEIHWISQSLRFPPKVVVFDQNQMSDSHPIQFSPSHHEQFKIALIHKKEEEIQARGWFARLRNDLKQVSRAIFPLGLKKS